MFEETAREQGEKECDADEPSEHGEAESAVLTLERNDDPGDDDRSEHPVRRPVPKEVKEDVLELRDVRDVRDEIVPRVEIHADERFAFVVDERQVSRP